MPATKIDEAIKIISNMKNLLDDLKHRRNLERSPTEASAIAQYGGTWKASLLNQWLMQKPEKTQAIMDFDKGLQEILGEDYLKYNNALATLIRMDLYSKDKVLSDPARLKEYLKKNPNVVEYINKNAHKLSAINDEFMKFVKEDQRDRRILRQLSTSDSDSMKKDSIEDKYALLETLNKQLIAEIQKHIVVCSPNERVNSLFLRTSIVKQQNHIVNLINELEHKSKPQIFHTDEKMSLDYQEESLKALHELLEESEDDLLLETMKDLRKFTPAERKETLQKRMEIIEEQNDLISGINAIEAINKKKGFHQP